MTNANYSSDDFDELDYEITPDSLFVNKRISVRYRRNDIKAMVKTRRFIFPTLVQVNLLDISSKGASIHSDKKLKRKSRVIFLLEFKDEKRFIISAAVVHTRLAPRYGLRFDRYQRELAEHLLHTQTDLEFA